jgi:hypothetical protein
VILYFNPAVEEDTSFAPARYYSTLKEEEVCDQAYVEGGAFCMLNYGSESSTCSIRYIPLYTLLDIRTLTVAEEIPEDDKRA